MESWVKRDNPQIFVEADRLNEGNIAAFAAVSGIDLIEEIDPEHPEEMQPGLNVRTASGEIKRASLGMYLIKFGKHYFVSHTRPFELTYKPVNRTAPPPESIGDARKARGFADPFNTGRMV